MKPSKLGIDILGNLKPPQLQALAKRVNKESIYLVWVQQQDIKLVAVLLELTESYKQYLQQIESLIKKNQENLNKQLAYAAVSYKYYLLEQICLPDRSKKTIK